MTKPVDIALGCQVSMSKAIEWKLCRIFYSFYFHNVVKMIISKSKEIVQLWRTIDHGKGKQTGRKFQSAEKHQHPHRSHIPDIERLCHKSLQMALGQIFYFCLKISLCTLYPAYTTFKMMKEEDEMVKKNL